MDRGDAYREKGDLSKAMEDYKKALTLNPGDERKARIENALSNAYVDRSVDQKEASAELADYDEALRINPNNVVGLNNRGAVYTLKEEYDRAVPGSGPRHQAEARLRQSLSQSRRCLPGKG
jgi:tetratricopeptide (TPR) repeat protein